MKGNIYIYTRISKDPDGLRAGVERQRADCLALAARLYPGLPVTVLEDNDTSAYSRRPRPAYTALTTSIASNHVHAVVVYNLDRLHRHPRELESFIDTCQVAKLSRIHTVEGDLDLSSHDGQLMARIMGAVAKKESDDKSRRVVRALADRSASGLPSTGGWRRFGYARDMTAIIPSEAAVIRDAATRVIAGATIQSTFPLFAAVPSVSGRPWGQTSVRHVLTSPTIAGLRVIRGSNVAVRGSWPAIITEAEHHAILYRADRAKHPATASDLPRAGSGRPRAPRTSPLIHVLVCGLCGRGMRARSGYGTTPRRYWCPNTSFGTCSMQAIPADAPESVAFSIIVSILSGRDPRPSAPPSPHDLATLNDLRAAVINLEHRADELAAMFGAGVIDVGEWKTAREANTSRLDAARLDLHAHERANAHLDPAAMIGKSEVGEWWARCSVVEREVIVGLMFESITVHPAVDRTAHPRVRVEVLLR